MTKTEKVEHTEYLRDQFNMGDMVYTLIKNVSRSGMSRTIQVIKLEADSQGGIFPLYFGWRVAKVLGSRYDDKKEGVKVTGCGMDMGFHLVNNLSYALHGYDQTPEMTKAGVRPGYTLKHRWL